MKKKIAKQNEGIDFTSLILMKMSKGSIIRIGVVILFVSSFSQCVTMIVDEEITYIGVRTSNLWAKDISPESTISIGSGSTPFGIKLPF